MSEEQQEIFGNLQPEIVKKPEIFKCLKCGSTTFDLIKNIDIVDMLSFDEETGEPFIALFNIGEALQTYIPHKECDKAQCSECGEPVPKEWLKDLPDKINSDLQG